MSENRSIVVPIFLATHSLSRQSLERDEARASLPKPFRACDPWVAQVDPIKGSRYASAVERGGSTGRGLTAGTLIDAPVPSVT